MVAQEALGSMEENVNPEAGGHRAALSTYRAVLLSRRDVSCFSKVPRKEQAKFKGH